MLSFLLITYIIYDYSCECNKKFKFSGMVILGFQTACIDFKDCVKPKHPVNVLDAQSNEPY